MYKRTEIYYNVYVAIFICFATRAIHLVIVTELTSEDFIETLKEFLLGEENCLYLL